MWYARVDVKNQMFVIEDHDGNVIASRVMPSTTSPNPGIKVLMENDNNRKAWDRIQNLINAANEANTP